MIPLYSQCYVEKEGVGKVEAVCNDKPSNGISFSYCVRLRKNPNKLRWFEASEVNAHDGSDEEEDNDQAENQNKKPRRKGKRPRAQKQNMKLSLLAFGKGFKGKILEAEEVPPGYEWNPENLAKKPKKKKKKTLSQKKRYTGKDTHGRVRERWKKSTYSP